MSYLKFTTFLFALTWSAFGFASDANALVLSEKAGYHDERIIASNIVGECSNLGFKFSDSTRQFLQKQGFAVSTASDISEQTEGMSLKLTIINAVSAGNAFIGHNKSVSIEAQLFKDGELLDTFTRTRNSGGGFGAGFKGSCTVLHRCAHTLGKDVASWMAKNHKG
ncbi:hypothetical protein PVT68_10840 [Microbulbifer bruguierae]|uniref:DUF4410 domain-containing protein n=1 Tax=Microbulbifer bruguierae TaxID=3029061 RepID=A0ABY8N9I2_9GAMM|nr:hypothetical protein [Microbulbifer bruguierae]WGL15267.1 hypothetical protein PVT68_10840 [Microbulbifer bruguierae]